MRNHKIAELWYKETSNLTPGVSITPRAIVLHYTTGWSGTASRDWLLGRAGGTANTGTSAHLVIDRDGTAWQICAFNRRAWHAGPSRLGSLTDLNSHAVGIELVNAGWLKPDGQGGWVDDYGNRRSTQQLQNGGGFITARHGRVGGAEYAWPTYTEAQLQTAQAVVGALVAAYRVQAIVTHEEIDTRGWKTDPGPAFPLGAFQALVEDQSAGEDLPRVVAATRLNLRGGPGTGFERIEPPGSLPLGTRVQVLRQEAGWAFIEILDAPAGATAVEAGTRGWVSAQYLDRELADA